MQINGKTDVGKVRSANQDAFYFKQLDDKTAFAIVCDGMGGANAGNIASEIAVDVISEYIIKSYSSAMTSDSLSLILKSAIASANIEVFERANKNPDLSGMGTTVVAAIVKETSAVICHVGDSRAYLVNDNIVQLTRDHSVVQSLIESGKLTPEEAKVHPRKNVITRALGAEEDIIADENRIPIQSGDTLLLCTDGLTNYLDNQHIKEIINNEEIGQIPLLLINAANDNGGGDNITVVTVTL